ncbi:MAG: glycosyltransferase family 39 protein [Flavobacteriales bacterium]|nr:glycosyltransferase family 39 protein [Flavobacteriales bacterium]
MVGRFFFVFPIILALFGLIALGFSTLGHSVVLDHLNDAALDGSVDSYSAGLHGQIQGNLRIAALLLGILALSIFLMRAQLTVWFAGEGGITRFTAEVRKLKHDYTKRTSRGHKQMVLLIVMVGVILRCIMLIQPLTYDEAFTYTYFATRPIHIILSDYSYPNNHVLNTLLVKLFTAVLGVGKISLRLPAFVAAVACLPLFYLFVRHMFNRYIALVALAFVASSPRIIEYSALGRGYAITWLCMVIALLLGRRFAKENDLVSAMLIAVVCAIGMWAVPTMVYPALMIYLWLIFYILNKYKDSRAERVWNWLGSVLVFVFLSLLLYAPMLIVNGAVGYGRLSVTPDRTLEMFSVVSGDKALEIWAWFSDPGHFWISMLVCVGLVFAGFISVKYRLLMAAMFFGAVPLVVYQMDVPPPRVWVYTLFIFHLSSAIALYYLLKLFHDNGMKVLTERRRAVLTSFAVLIGFGVTGMDHLLGDKSRSGDAAFSAKKISASVVSEDRIITQYPWEAPVEFEAMANGVDRRVFYNPIPENGSVYVVVGTKEGQTLPSVLAHNGVFQNELPLFEVVDDTNGLKTFVARIEQSK